MTYDPTPSTRHDDGSVRESEDPFGLADAAYPVFVWDQDVDGFVWANDAGLAQWGALSLASFRLSRLDKAMPAMLKLKALSASALPVEGVAQTLTFWTPRGAFRFACRCRPVDLYDGGHGLMLEGQAPFHCAGQEAEFMDGASSVTSHGANRTAYLPNGSATPQRNGTASANLPPRRVAGYLNGSSPYAQSPEPAAGAADKRTQDLPTPSADDHLAMQEIARMLGQPGTVLPDSTGSPDPASPLAVPASPVPDTARPGPGEHLRSSGSGAASDGVSHSVGSGTELPRVGHANVATRFDTLNHELRTPLNSIIGFAEMMHREQLGPIGTARYKEYAGDILESARHALSLINDLLDASRVRAGHLDVTLEELQVPPFLDRVIALLEPQANAASVTIVPGYPSEMPTLLSDPRALRQILLNVVTNALKFTPPGGHIFLSARQGAGLCMIDVRDTGIGMTEEQIADALKPWVRNNGDDMPGTAAVGSGLGLPLVQALTNALDGTLAISSAPGEGTCVTIQLPMGET